MATGHSFAKIQNKIETQVILEPPPKNILKNFFIEILTKFNSFETLIGFFTQKEGCSMGSKLSPTLANIFCHMYESTIITEEINKGNIIHHLRYADDSICIIKKGKPKIFYPN